MTRDRKAGASALAGHERGAGRSPGKRMLTQRLPARKHGAAAPPVQAAPAPGLGGVPLASADGAPGLEPHDDPFGLHLLGAGDGDAAGDDASAAAPAPGAAVQRSASSAPASAGPRAGGVTRVLDRAQADGRDADAIAYLDHNRGPILAAIRRHIARHDWPLGHPRLRWRARPAQVAATLLSRLVAIAHEAEGPVWWARHASAFFFRNRCVNPTWRGHARTS